MGDWRANLVSDDAGLRRMLAEARTIAVLGAKAEPPEPACAVPAYRAARGYRILPVNPRLAGRVVHGVPAVDRVADLGESADGSSGRLGICPGTPRRSWPCPPGPPWSGFSLASGTSAPPSGSPARAFGSSRIAA